MTPNAFQIEHWQEYQVELAKHILSRSGEVFPGYASAICEWDILGSDGQLVYVWAICKSVSVEDTRPAVMHLSPDGKVREVEVPFHESDWEFAVASLFPPEVRSKIDAYYASDESIAGRDQLLRSHLEYRLAHPSGPPLIIVEAASTPSP